MKAKKILSENMYSVFFTLCTVMLAESMLLRIADVFAAISVGLTAIISVAVVLFLYLNRKNSAVYIGAAAVLAVVFAALNLAGVPLADFIVSTTFKFFSSEELAIGETIFITFVMSFVLSLVIFALSKIKLARYITAIIALSLLICCGFIGIIPDLIESFSFAGLILSVLAEFSLSLKYQKESHKKIGSVISFLLPLLLVFSLATAVIPTSEEPVSWQPVIRIIDSVAGFFKDIAEDIQYALNPSAYEFGVNMQGYSDESNAFGGGLSAADTTQLYLTTQSRPRSALYLIGSVSDIYSGSSWRKSEYSELSLEDYYLDYCETMCAFERAGYTKDELKDFTAVSILDVRYGDISTNSLFYPLKTFNISISEDYNAASPSISFNSRASAGTDYELKSLEVNYTSDNFTSIAQSGFSYDNVEKLTEHTLDSSIPLGVEETLAERAKLIKEKYTVLPENISERTFDLANDITNGCPDDYKKLCAIEAYLKTYVYTLTPASIPDGREAVDYFLFESKEGYCTYFASAMAVLARCEGIPTRYVQGFSVPDENHARFNNLAVLGSRAHAWVEAYIEGIGWIPFEPTAAFQEARYGFRENTSYNSWNNHSDFDYSHYIDNNAPVPSEEVEQTNSNNDSSDYVPVILLSLLAVAIIIIIYIAIRIHTFKSNYKKATDTEKFRQCYKIITYLCNRRKLVRKDGETADCFAKRVEQHFNTIDASFSDITTVFDKIRYGGKKATGDELQLIEQYLELVFAEIKKSNGKFAALIAYTGYCFK